MRNALESLKNRVVNCAVVCTNNYKVKNNLSLAAEVFGDAQISCLTNTVKLDNGSKIVFLNKGAMFPALCGRELTDATVEWEAKLSTDELVLIMSRLRSTDKDAKLSITIVRDWDGK